MISDSIKIGNKSFTLLVDMFDAKDPITVAIHDAFVVKYDTGVPVGPATRLGDDNSARADTEATTPTGTAAAPSQTYLPLHCDQSSHSFTIALNGVGEYEGGGTYFPSLGAVMRPGRHSFSIPTTLMDYMCDTILLSSSCPLLSCCFVC